MPPTPTAQACARILQRIHEAAVRAGRHPEEVSVVAVTKGVSPDRIREAAGAGIRMVGENRVQDACLKQEAFGGNDLEWHLIGPLQSNKVNRAVGRFALLHGIDSPERIRQVGARASSLGIRQRILLQVNTARDPRKSGLAPEEAPEAIAVARTTPGIQLEGFMTLASQDAGAPEVRATFRALRDLRDRHAPECPILSMGMTADFELAISEGATHLRIGSGIFGQATDTQQEAR